MTPATSLLVASGCRVNRETYFPGQGLPKRQISEPSKYSHCLQPVSVGVVCYTALGNESDKFVL